ncbi:MAG: SusC/RagA family TonB-linked outer membrane protein [bacterium]
MIRNSVLMICAVCAPALTPAVITAQQQGTTISGHVRGAGGNALAGASVGIAELGAGTVVRESGDYSFTIPATRVQGQSVTISAKLIGYRLATATVVLRAGPITQDFTLVANPLQLGEVVITGAGTATTREKLGTVINTVDSSAIARSNEVNIVNALAAKAPNVQIVSSSGQPGASSYIRIRGIKSLSGTAQPLFVVDGIPIDNSTTINGSNLSGANTPNRASDIDPNDIENIEILKGSAAAAIYGARASDGVILITTKAGKAGQTRYSLRTSQSSDDVTKSFPLQTKYGQGTKGASGTCSTENCSGTTTSWGPALGSTATFNHFDELFRTGRTSDVQAQISGGNEKTSFFVSGGRVDQTGVVVGDNNFYIKHNARLKASSEVMTGLTIGGNASIVDVRNTALLNGGAVSGLLLGALRTPPDFNNFPYLDSATGLQRSYRFPHPGAGSSLTSRGYDNPFFALDNNPNSELTDRTTASINADYQASAWLKLAYALGGDYYGDTQMTGYALTASDFPKGRVQRTTAERLQLDHNLTATASHSFGEKLSGTLTLGQNLNSRRVRDVSSTGSDLIAPLPFALNNTVSQASGEGISTIHTESYFGQATADFFSQLFLTAGVRNDGFSTFGQSNPRAWYPKASVAWTFTNLLTNVAHLNWLSYGKARVSYGETGKEPGVYSTNTTLTSGSFGSGFGDVTKATQGGFGGLLSGGTLGNPNLRPERQKEVEGGFDFGFLDQMADAGFTYYDNKSTDVILSVPRPATSGFSAQLLNGASLESRGYEGTLNLRPITRKNFSWDLGFQYGQNKTTVNDLQGALFVGAGGGTFAEAVPQAVVGGGFVFRGLGFARCGMSTQSTLRDNKNAVVTDFDSACSGKEMGTMYIDASGLPIKDPAIRQIADPNPKWTGSFHTSMKIRGFLITALVDHKQGGQIINTTRGSLYNFGTHKDTELRDVNLVFGTDILPGKVVGPGAGVPVLIGESWYTGLGSSNSNIEEEFAEDGGYTKLREISVAYTLDISSIRRMGFSSIDLRVAGRNLRTWTSYSGLDPETNLAGASGLLQGYDFFNMPQTRSFVFSLSLNR